MLAELRTNADRFKGLARGLSDCPSAGVGGRLGQVVWGDATPEFEAALAAMDAGQICREPVQIRYDAHVVRLDRRSTGQLLPFAQVRERIATSLEDSAWRRAVAQYVAVLAGAADIAGFDMPGAASPLVQ